MKKLELSTKAADLAARATVAQIKARTKAGLVMPDVADAAIRMRQKLDENAQPTNARAKLGAVAAALEAALPGALTKREQARKMADDQTRPEYEAALKAVLAKAVAISKKPRKAKPLGRRR